MRVVAPLSFACMLVGAACSGAAPSQLTVPPSESAGGDDSAASGSISGSQSGSSSGSDVPDATMIVDHHPMDEGGGPVEASGTDVSVDTSLESGPEAGPQGILCGSGNYCSGGTFCCMTTTGGGLGGAMQQFKCVTNGCGMGIGNTGVPIRCADTADCMPGQVCCSTQLGTNIQSISCQTGQCPPGSLFMSYSRLCTPGANDCPTNTPNCRASTVIPAYSACAL